MSQEFRYLFGPVSSWRLGTSLGVDPLSNDQKVCNFNCVYCQLGEAQASSSERRNYVATQDILDEVMKLPPMDIDYITFSGRGEPTLAKNLGDMITRIRKIRQDKIAVITNGSLIGSCDVQEDLLLADFVLVKLDAFHQESLTRINQPAQSVDFEEIVSGLKIFREKFKGKLALQIMFIDDNKEDSKRIASLAREIQPDEIQINTPLRPSAVKPLSRAVLEKIKQDFQGLPVTFVYDADQKVVTPMSMTDTEKRHGRLGDVK